MNKEKEAWLLAAATVVADVCCHWPWGGNGGGYGRVRSSGAEHSAHVIACTIANGERPPGRDAAHSCGRPSCCTGRHLRWATRSENLADRVTHGTMVSGARNGQAKLTEDDVRAIRVRYAAGGTTQQQLGDEYGVTKTNVSAIVGHRKWKSVEA